MTFADALRFGAKTLAWHRCPGADAVRDSELLLMHASRSTREQLALAPEKKLSSAIERRFRQLIARRAKHEPMAYLLGTAWFLGREYAVSPATLIPRPATEQIVLAAIASANARRPDMVADIGTGSGCVAISLAAALPDSRVFATDISAPALRVAKKNAARHKVSARITFSKGDLLAPIAAALTRSKDAVIIANLPYLPAAMIPKLAPDVRRYEPRSALVAGRDGLLLYKKFITQLAAIPSTPRLRIFLEILPKQFSALKKLAQKKFPGAVAEKLMNDAGICIGIAIETNDHGTT